MKNKGIIPINKPSGWTSFDVVNKIKHLVRPLKVGHLGTLDPMATGVLLVTVGKATKLFDIMQEKRKTYIAKFKLGVLTDTLDSTGEILEEQEVRGISKSMVVDAMQKFVGNIEQVPPKYSAKSVNGTRAYTLARNNVDFVLPAKKVTVYNIELIDFAENVIELKIECGSGTYIRSLGRDIAKELNTVATMTELQRIQVGNVSVDKCFEVKEIQKEQVFEYVMEINNFLSFEEIKLTEQESKKLLNGLILDVNVNDGIYKLNDVDDTIALVKIDNFKAKMWLFLG